MRTPQLIVAVATLSLIATIACQKTKVVPAPASITVVNAMAENSSIVPKFGSDTAGRYYMGPTYGSTMVPVWYGASQLYSPVAGVTPLLVVPSTDTGFTIFKGSLTFNSGDIYSLFLSGDTAHADTMLVKDNIPYYSDSSAGVRFVNLSMGGKALTINLDTDPGNMEFPALGYKGITGFKKYDASPAAGDHYNFEIRDQASGDLLTTFTWSFPRFRNMTVVIAGSTDPGSATPLTIFSVNNF
jgi:hypothetical protein